MRAWKQMLSKNWHVFLGIAVLFFISRNFLASGWRASITADWDWDQYWATREVVRRFWMAGGSLFPWVAQFCGGFPILDSTEIPVHSPFLLFWQWIGTVPGTKWEFVTLLSVGLVGMYRATGALFPSAPSWVRAVGGLHFVICGFFLFHLNAGHFSFAEFSLFSWIIYGFVTQRSAPIALALAAGVHLGANNYFMHAILFTVIAGVVRWSWMPLVIRSGLWSGVLAAPLLVYNLLEYPKAKYLRWSAANHHEMPETLDRLIGYMIQPITYLWDRPACPSNTCDFYWEFGNYIGITALVLGVVGLIYGSRKLKDLRPWATVGVIYTVIALGPFAEWAPFRLFWNLPLFSRLEVNTRFLIGLTAVLFLGWVWVLGVWFQKNHPRRIASMVLAALSIIPCLAYAQKMFDQPAFDGAKVGRVLEDLRGRPADMKQMATPYSYNVGKYEALTQQLGVNVCHISSSKGSYPGKIQVGKGALLEAPHGSTASWDDRYWWVEWNSGEGGKPRWVLNQNYNENFVVDSITSPQAQAITFAQDDLIGFEVSNPSVLSAGKQVFRLRLRTPTPVLISYGVSLIGWMIFLFQFVNRSAAPSIGKAKRKTTKQ